MPLAIKINPKDNVVVALHPIAKGTAVPVDGASVTAVEDIPQGHKMAIAPQAMKTDKMADLGSLHTFVYACPLLFLSGIDKVFVFLYLSLLMRR